MPPEYLSQRVRTLALVVEYDGTGYAGFQRQDSAPSIARELEAAFGMLLRHDIKLVAAGRTDAGVHATGQVVSLSTPSDFPLERLPVAASAILRDRGIAVLRATERAIGFSARFDALARTYRYRILNRAAPSPLERLRLLHVSAPLDVAAMRGAATRLLGRHDFAALSALGPENGSTVRTVTGLSVETAGDRVEIEVTADSFLRRMMRIVVGTLIEMARGSKSAADMSAILASRDRARAGFTAPAHGLYLTHVEYADPL